MRRSLCGEATDRAVPDPTRRVVSHGEWLLQSVDGDSPLPKEVPHWDYQTDLGLAAPVSVDRGAVTEACHLDFDSGLAVFVMAKFEPHQRWS